MKLAAVGDNCMDVYENIGKAYPGGNPVNVAVYFVRIVGRHEDILGDYEEEIIKLISGWN